MNKGRELRDLIAANGMLVAPGVYDAFSACLVEAHRFKAAYLTGAGAAASMIGHPDLGLTTMTEMSTHARHITGAIDLPVIADADTGYGNPLNVRRTVIEYERAGLAGMHIEDQTFPKRCGHLDGKTVIPAPEFEAKIQAAVEARNSDDFLIIARTDSRGPLSIDEAIDRANRYSSAGADGIFVEAPESEAEIARIADEVESQILLFNMVASGKTPDVELAALQELGYALVIVPGMAMRAAAAAMNRALDELAERGQYSGPGSDISPRALFQMVGMDRWAEFDQRYERAEAMASINPQAAESRSRNSSWG